MYLLHFSQPVCHHITCHYVQSCSTAGSVHVDLPSNSTISLNATEAGVVVGQVPLYKRLHRGGAWCNVFFLFFSPTRSPRLHALSRKWEPSQPPAFSHEGQNRQEVAERNASSHISHSQVSVCGLRLKVMYCLLVWHPLVCMFHLFFFFLNNKASPGPCLDIALSIKFTLIAWGFFCGLDKEIYHFDSCGRWTSVWAVLFGARLLSVVQHSFSSHPIMYEGLVALRQRRAKWSGKIEINRPARWMSDQ